MDSTVTMYYIVHFLWLSVMFLISLKLSSSAWVPELVALGYDKSLPTPINIASQTAMAAVTSKNVHSVIQQLDRVAVELNNESNDPLSQQGQVALLLDTLGIAHWISLQFTFKTNGADAAVALIRQYHEELPQILEIDSVEDSRSEKLAANIALALSWDTLERNIPVDETVKLPDVPTQVKSNPLISFEHFTEDEKCQFSDQLDNFAVTQATGCAVIEDIRDPFVPVDTPRNVEYRASKKKRYDDAKEGNLVAKIHPLLESIKMASFRDRYKCPEVATVRIKMNMATDSSRVAKHKMLLWNWLCPYLRCACKTSFGKQDCNGEICWFDHSIWYISNQLEDFFPHSSLTARYMAFLIFLGSDARNAVLAQCTFIYARRLMIEAAAEFFSDPSAKLLAQYGDAFGIRTIERLIKPACFSDGLVTEKILASRKRSRSTNSLNLNLAQTRIVPMGRGQRMALGISVILLVPIPHDLVLPTVAVSSLSAPMLVVVGLEEKVPPYLDVILHESFNSLLSVLQLWTKIKSLNVRLFLRLTGGFL
ncbi:hypothetical protein R1sor_022236 [Riccia sorocarpa]|uniref:C3H1-type domain-containing protein n=1 Tax=Riccia sorocarpa TaxID=122646 RepID=A0ABD3GMG0_9MARC